MQPWRNWHVVQAKFGGQTPVGSVAGGSALRKMHWGMSLVEVAPDKETSLGHPYPFTSVCGVKVVRHDVVPMP